MVVQDRLRIGIFFGYTSIWLGGVYYIKSLINSLNCLEDELKPFIVVFYTDNSSQFIKEFDYAYIEFKKFKPINVYAGYLGSWLLQKNLFTNTIIENNNLDGLFPVNDVPVRTKSSKTKIVSWFPDLQHKFYPNYFSKSHVFFRELRLKILIKNSQTIVVSSKDVSNHFHQFYKLPDQLQLKILPFVSNIKKSSLDVSEVRNKYGIKEDYFIVSNQFYEHKNHKLVYEAIALMKTDYPNLQVVFTGKFEDYKNPNYISNLEIFIRDKEIESQIKILGIIPRDEQICLLENALAVIQPSLFEGWSTIVEDAKTLQIPIIVSDINVHKEQLGDKGFFFNSTSNESLAEVMVEFINKTNRNFDYFDNFIEREKSFANGFVSIFR